MKRLLAIVLAIVLCTAYAAAEITAPGEYPIVNDKAELSVFTGARSDVEDYTTNYLTTWYEEKTNVHVNWQLTNSTEENQNYNLSLTSGNYPDIYLHSYEAANAGELLTLADDGVIIPLNDLIDNNTVYIKAYLEAHPEIREAITAPDGNIYSLFTYLCNVEQDAYLKLWVYKPWLQAYTEATGNAKPVSTEEFETMLVYFRDHDMNGNGDPNDEMPLAGSYQYGNQGSDPMYALLNSFCFVPGSPSPFVYADGNGGVETSVNTDEFRNGLRYINHLYEEKLLVEDTYVQDLNQFRATTTVAKDKVTVGVGGAGMAMRLLNYTGDPAMAGWEDYECLEPLTGPEGYKGTPQGVYDRVIFRGTITTACQDPVLAIRWLDWFWSEEGSNWTLFKGQEGVHWEWCDEPSFAGENQSVKFLYQYGSTQNIYFPTGWGIGYLKDLKTITSIAASDTFKDSTLATLYNRDRYLADYMKPIGLPSSVWCSDNDLIMEKAELDALFGDYIVQTATEFVTGVKDINDDDAWNNYVNELNRMKLSHYLDVLAKYYYGK